MLIFCHTDCVKIYESNMQHCLCCLSSARVLDFYYNRVLFLDEYRNVTYLNAKGKLLDRHTISALNMKGEVVSMFG